MTARISLVLLSLCVLCPVRAAEDAKTARATLDRAIKAMGGEKLLAAKALSGTSRGTVEVLGNTSPITNEWTVQGLDQLKWVTEVKIGDNTGYITLVMNGDKAWTKGNNGEAAPLAKEQLKALQQGFIALRVVESLLPLSGKEWKLSSLGELKIDDTTTVGIRATKKGQPDLEVYFDKTTHLPIKAAMSVKEPDGTELPYTARFATYKKVEGRQYFTKLTVHRDDKVLLEMERSDLKAKDKVDDETFDKP